MKEHTRDERNSTTDDTARQHDEQSTGREDGNPERHQAHKQGMTSHSQKEADVRGTLPRTSPSSQPEQGAFGRETGRGESSEEGGDENHDRGARDSGNGGGDGAGSNKQE